MNNIRLTLEFDISQGKKGWNDFLSYGKNVKEQMNGLFISPTEFSGFGAINKEAVTAGSGVDELVKKIQALETQLEKLRTKSTTGTGMPQFTQITGNARMAVSSFNYTLQDSGMFFVNFRMGMMAISNNMPMLIQGLVGMKREAVEGNKSFKTYLKESFSGPNAFLPVMSLVGVAMIALPAIFDKIKEAAKNTAEEGIKRLTKELEGLSNVQLTKKLDDTKAEIMQFAVDILKMRSILGPLANWFSDDDVRLEAKIKELQLLTDEKGKREELKKTILGRLDLEKKDLEEQKKKTDSVMELYSLNYKIAQVDEKIKTANMTAAQFVKEENSSLDKQLKTIKEIYAIKKQEGPDLTEAESRLRQEQELARLEIENIQDKEEREVKLSLYKYKLEVERIRKEVSDKDLEFKLIAELYKKHLQELDDIRSNFEAKSQQAETDDSKTSIEEQFNLYKAMYESAADVLRSEVGKAWQDIFGEANSLLEKFAQNLLSTFLDAALNEAAKKLFSGGGGRGGRAKEWYEYIPVIGSFFGLFGGGGDASPAGAPKRIDGTGNETVNTAVLNRSLMPSANEVRVITMQPDMSVVRDEIRSWAKEVNFSWAYNEWRAGMKALEHRDSFEE